MTASSVIVSIALCLIVLLAVGFFRVATTCYDKVQAGLYDILDFGQAGFNVDVETIDGTLMKAIVLRNVTVSSPNGTLAHADRIEVTSSIWKVVKAALGLESAHFDIAVYNLKADSSVLAFATQASGSGTSTVSGDQSSEAALPAKLDFSFLVNIVNASVDVDYQGITTTIDGINASASFGRDLAFKDADINIPKVFADVPKAGPVEVDDIRLSMDSNLTATASVARASIANYGIGAYGISAIAGLNDTNAGLAFFVQTLQASYLGYDAVLESSTFNVGLPSGGIENDVMSVIGTISNASLVSENEGLSVTMYGTSVSGIGKGSDVDLDISTNEVEAQLRDYFVDIKDFGINLDASLEFGDILESSALGSIGMSLASAKGLEGYTIQDAQLQNLDMDVSLKDKKLDIRFKSLVQGTSTNVYVGEFSSNADSDISLSFENGISHVSAALSSTRIAAVPDEANLSFDYVAGGEMKLSFNVSEDLEGTARISFEDDQMEARLYLEDLNPYSYDVVFENLLASQDFIRKETSFDGSIVFSLGLESGVASRLVSTQLAQTIEGNTLGGLVSNGRFSTNIAVHDLSVDDSLYSGAVSFEASLEDTLLNVGTLAVSTGGFRLSYSGTIDYIQMIPDGALTLQDANDGNELARLDFNSIEDTLLYSFVLTSPLVKDSSVHGTLDWQNSSAITASAVLESQLFSNKELPFSVTVVKSPLEIQVRSEELNLDAGLSPQNQVRAKGTVKGLEVKASDTMSVAVDMEFDASYNILSGELGATLEGLAIRVSDILEFGFSSDISNTKLNIHDVFVRQNGDRTIYEGNLEVSYSSLQDLISLDPAKLAAVMDISDSTSGTYAKGTIVDGDYYLDARLASFVDIEMTVLGSKGYGFHSYGSVQWGSGEENGFSFNSQYRGGRLGFYDSKGRVGSLELNDVGLSLDFNEMAMEFSFSFINTVSRKASDAAMQSGTITLAGRLETLASSLLSAVAGLDSDISFTLGLKDFRLEDGFAVPDTEVDILYSNGKVDMEGALMNGTFDIASGYLDLHIDKSFLFGLDAKGYIGKELDLMVTNLYFPLPLIEQFTDMMLLGFTKGDITGDVLIKGPADDPRFYGMLYCQQFEMWMVYLPQQSLVVNNIAIALQDHSVTIPQTPYTGYSSLDGRFLSGLVSVSMDVQNLNFGNMEVSMEVETPIDLWMPLLLDGSEIEVRGDAKGHVDYGLRNGVAYLNSVVTASNMLVDFKIDEKPRWIYFLTDPINMDVTLTTGRDVEFCYPEKDNAFINFTLNEGETVRVVYQVDPLKIETSGSFSFKTGQVYYFQNDFYISEGTLDLTPRKFGSSIDGISFQLDLIARLKDYDSSGNRVEINLILQNATLDNISPRFTSTPSMSETDIIALLGQTILPSSTFDQGVSVASVASLAAAATDAATRLGIIESNSNYSLSSIVRDSLGLDIFSLRSSILQNIIIDALPGGVSGRNDISLLSKYLDGTSLFAGSYIMPGVFAQTSFRLKADRNGGRNSNVGHFLSNDLMLDMEFSIDWDNPIGTFTIFTKPQELSPFSILDSIGFSVTKRIQF